MEAGKLTAEETTGLYALRKAIADETNGQLNGFPTILRALRSVGLSARQAVADIDGAVAALSEAGYFVDHMGGVTFNRPIFFSRGADHIVPLGPDIDSVPDTESITWLREHFEGSKRAEMED